MANSIRRNIAAVMLFSMIAVMALMTAAEPSAAASTFKPKVKVDANKVTITWKKQKGFKKYEVYSKLFYSKAKIKKVKTTKGLSYSFKGKYCTRYRVYIRAIKGNKKKQSKIVEYETGSNPALKIKRIASLPSYKVNSNYNAAKIDAMCFVGDDLYYLKSAHNAIKKEVHKGFYPMVLCCIKDFASYTDTQNPPATFKVIRYANGELYYGEHSSSITYYDGDFYIVTVESHKKNGKPIIRVGRDGKIKEEISTKDFYYNGIKFSAFAFYGIKETADGEKYPQFICRDGKNTTRVTSKYGYELHRFSVGTLKDGVLKRDFSFMTRDSEEETFWQSDVGKNGSNRILHSNDIGYDVESGMLLHPIFIYEKNKNIKTNWLYTYDVANSTEVWPYDDDQLTNSLVQKSMSKIALNTERSSETKLEIEGVDAYQGNVYIGVNTDGVEDGLYLVK